MREAPCEPEWRLEWVSSWNFQASSCQPVSRALSWGGDWCSVAYQTQARTPFLVTVFLLLKSAGKETAAPEVKTRFHFMCDVGLPGLCDLVFGADVNPKCAYGISVEWNVCGVWIWGWWVIGVCIGCSDAI